MKRNNRSYLKQTFKHLLLGLVFNLILIFLGYIVFETINAFATFDYRSYLVGIIITPIIVILVSHDWVSAVVNYILNKKG